MVDDRYDLLTPETYQLHVCDDISNCQHKGFFVQTTTRIIVNISLCELNYYSCICERREKRKDQGERENEGRGEKEGET